MESFLQELALGLEKFGTGAYLIVFLVVLLETVVVLGQFLPGSLFLILVGFLCYMSVFDFSAMTASVLLAHLGGEFINYGIGRTKGRALFREESRFFKPRFLEMAESRFQSSGARLLVTGQFLGFLRPFISLAAGVTHYSLVKFAIVELIACSIWAVAHLAVGFFFGASWQQAVTYMRDFSLVVIIAVPLAVFCGWFIRQLLAFSGSLYRVLDRLHRIIKRTPGYRNLQQKHPLVYALLDKRISLSKPWGLGAVVGFSCALMLLGVTFFILWNVTTRGGWHTFDLSLVNLLAQLRTPGANHLFGIITNLGAAPVVTTVVILAGLFSFFARQYKSLFVIVGSVVLSMLASEFMEVLFQRARPDLSLHAVQAHGFSFPSGHATVAFALFGSLYYWLWNHPGVLRIRATLAFLLLMAAFLVGFSRVYLGVHYPSDVVSGFCVGFAGVLICGTIAANWTHLTDVQSRADVKAGIIMLIYAIGAVTYAYVKPVHGEGRLLEGAVRAENLPLDKSIEFMPRDSTTLFGHNYVPVNLVLQGQAQALSDALEKSDWKPVRPSDFFTRGMADPVFPAFLDGKPAGFSLQQETAEGRRILRLWPMPYTVQDKPLWAGTIVEQKRLKKWGRIDVYHQSPDVDLARDHFAEATGRFRPQLVRGFRERGLYPWPNPFFTLGAAVSLTVPQAAD